MLCCSLSNSSRRHDLLRDVLGNGIGLLVILLKAEHLLGVHRRGRNASLPLQVRWLNVRVAVLQLELLLALCGPVCLLLLVR